MPPPRQAIEEQVSRLLASPVFSKSDRMSRFLRFIVDRTLAGQGADLKEYTIALEVFDKDDSFDPRIDPTVRSEARRLRAKLAEYYESADDRILIELPKGSYAAVFTERSPTAVEPPRRRTFPNRSAAGLAIALVVILAVATTWWLRRRPAIHAGPRSIAVLPFENLSADPANEYFSDGLTEEVLNALANAPGFKVVARTSAFQFKGKHEDIRSIGKKLNVEMVLEGTVRKDGNRIRITPQLINVADGYHLWSAEYDRQWNDLFAVQREIATAIAGALGGKLGHVTAQPVDAGTYALYLEARHYLDQWNRASMLKATELFKQVVARDPNYAPGYAGLSSAYGLLTALGSDAIPPQETRARAKTAAFRAIELDPNSAEAWTSLAPKLVEDFDWPSAESAFRKALDLGPNSSDAHAWYAELYLTPLGMLDEALRESQAAATLDPISPYATSGVGRRYYFLRQYDSAITWLRKALELDPHFNIAVGELVHAYIAKGDTAGARRFLESQRPLWPERMLAIFWSQVLAAEGNRTEAAKMLSGFKPGPAAVCPVAAAYASVGDKAQVMSWLDQAIERRSGCFTMFPVDPLYARWHGTPEFEALLHKMKLNGNH